MVNKHQYLQNSECVNKYLHRFDIVEQYESGVLEICQLCKLKKFFKIIDDRVNSEEYMAWHLRNALPPSHPLYYHEYEYDPLEDKIISPYV